jgi:hypothetical protein
LPVSENLSMGESSPYIKKVVAGHGRAKGKIEL